MMSKVFRIFCAICTAGALTAGVAGANNNNNLNVQDVQCTASGSPVSVKDVCEARSDADAESECAARATAFSRDTLNQICSPYVEQNAHQVCKPVVDANAAAFCGGYLNQRLQNELELRMGDITNICQGDHDYATLAVHLSGLKATCLSAASQSQNANLVCADTQLTAMNVGQSCSNQCPACPNVQPVCAAWKYRRFPNGTYQPVRCRRWVTVVVQPVN